MANIVLKTFAAGDDGQGTVTPQDDAFIYQNAIPMNGIFSGATVTLSEANVLHVAAGFGIIGGRFFEINESDITVELSSSGTLLGRLYIHLELTNADVPISINVATGASLPALVGDPDLNINDGAFDLELATFNVSEVTISDIVNTFPTISKANNQLRRATAYFVNDMVLCQSASDSLIFICTTAGTTAIQEPTAYATVTDGNTVTDGTAAFKAVSVSGQITKLSKTEDLISIVENGNTCTHTGGISKGQYVNWKGDLYTADSNISVGATFASSGGSKNLTAVTDGGLNELNDRISSNTLGIAVAMTANTNYTAPSDGYFQVSIEYDSTSKYIIGRIEGQAVLSLAVPSTALSTSPRNSVFVKKGMILSYETNAGSGSAGGRFIPIS
jgi:hypothetical protein